MENLGLTHELDQSREKQLDDLIERWGVDVREAWVQKYEREVVEVVNGEGKVTQMWRTALITVCRVREARAAAHQAQLENAYYGNRAPGITDEELNDYIAQRDFQQRAG